MSSNRHGQYGRSHHGWYNLRRKAPRSFSTLHSLGFSADDSPNELLAPVVEEIEFEEPDAGLSTEDEEGAVGSDSEPSGADCQPFGPPELLSDSTTELATR